MHTKTMLVALLLLAEVCGGVVGQELTIVGDPTARSYRWREWATLPDGQDLGNTHGCIVIDAAGRVYVNTDTEQAVVVLAPDGGFVKAWGKEFRGGLHGMTLRREGDREVLYLAHTGRHEVVKATLDGEVEWTLGFPEESGLYKNAGEYRPTSVVVAPNGDLFVADGYGKSWVHQFTKDRSYVRSFGGRGTEPGKMQTPHGMWLDTRQEPPTLIVADRENHRLQIFDLAGNLKEVVTGMLRRPCNVHQHGSELVVADLAGRITLLDAKNQLIAHLGDQPDPKLRAQNGVPRDRWVPGQFISPHSACFDQDGNIYVMDWVRQGRITRLDVVRETPSGTAVADVSKAELGSVKAVHRSGELWLTGQFEGKDLPHLKEAGIRRVITLRGDGEVKWDEKGGLEGQGISFESIPFRKPETLTDEVFHDVRKALRSRAGPTVLHCGSANRVGGVWLAFRVLDEGVSVERALEEAKRVGLRSAEYEKRALDYIERHRGETRPKSVKEGINAPFKNPDLDVDAFVKRFEVESREVYVAREAILEACELKSGMRVADVGAGTGLFTSPFLKKVGASGWVFAVDIAPRFLQHILKNTEAEGLKNVSGVLCAEDSINLPPESVDMVFVCDTYHHFEFPAATLASIHLALKPGARFLVVDFERIPGVSSDWILGHVRAGKEVFRAEIEKAGFRFVRQIEVKGLKDNYCLEFRRPD